MQKNYKHHSLHADVYICGTVAVRENDDQFGEKTKFVS